MILRVCEQSDGRAPPAAPEPRREHGTARHGPDVVPAAIAVTPDRCSFPGSSRRVAELGLLKLGLAQSRAAPAVLNVGSQPSALPRLCPQHWAAPFRSVPPRPASLRFAPGAVMAAAAADERRPLAAPGGQRRLSPADVRSPSGCRSCGARLGSAPRRGLPGPSAAEQLHGGRL